MIEITGAKGGNKRGTKGGPCITRVCVAHARTCSYLQHGLVPGQ